MVTRFLTFTDSIDAARFGWFASGGGIVTSVVANFSEIEPVLKLLVLLFTLLTLILTAILQIRALRKS